MEFSVKAIKGQLKKVKIKGVLGSLGFAVLLWLFVSLNDSYITWVQIPLVVDLPANRALERAPEQMLLFEVRGTGWQLFSLLFFNTTARCYLNLNKVVFNNDVYNVTKDELIKSADLMKNIEIKNVRPESIQIFTGQISSKKVPVIPDIEIIPGEGFTVVGKLKIEPDSVLIKGNSRIVENIRYWNTEKMLVKGKIKSFSISVGLKDTLRNIIDFSPNYVNILANIQQSAQKSFKDVEIKVLGKQLPSNYVIQPQRITVILTGGIEEISKLSINDVSAYINYNEVISDSVGIFKPEIKIPDNVKLLNIEPSLVRIFKQTK